MNKDPIIQIWVIKRRLDSFANPFHVRSLSHSALMVRTSKGDEHVLEYMADGRAHLYKAEYGVHGENKPGVTDYIRMRDEMGMEWTWVMEVAGEKLPKDVQVTLNQAKKKLQEVMGRDYEPLREYPHQAQEKLRESWGITVKNNYVEEGFDVVEDDGDEEEEGGADS